MDRFSYLRTHLTKESEGIEIGPFHSPIVSKKDGYKSVVMDVFSYDHLIETAPKIGLSPELVAQIEPVDLMGPAQDIATLVKEKYGDRKFDYVISSHNFEHLPDPIRFLQGCRDILKPGGYLSMAIPDHRCCFDYFRPVSTVADLLEAYFEKRTKPSDKQLFLDTAMRAEQRTPTGAHCSFDIYTDPSQIYAVEGSLPTAYSYWRDTVGKGDAQYIDAHCWAFTPSSFHLIVLDFQQVGLMPFTLESIYGPLGNEFLVHLRAEDPPTDKFEERRLSLMRAVLADESVRVAQYYNGLISAREREAENLKASLAEMRRSTSWRVTAPMRRLKEWFAAKP